MTYNRSIPSATALTANLTVSTAGTGTFTAVGFTTTGSSSITITKLTSETCFSTITSNNTATVIVSPATAGGTVTGGTAIPSGHTSGLLTLSGQTGSVVKWQSSVSPFSTWLDIVNTNTTYTSGVLTETTRFRAVVQSGTCSAANSASTTVTVNPLPTITASASAQNGCSHSLQEYSTPLFYSAVTGSPITYSIVWNSSPANSFAAVTDESLEPGFIKIIIPAGTATGTYTGTLTVKDSDGVSSLASTFTVNIGQFPEITATGAPIRACSSSSAANVLFQYLETTANPTSYSIDWDSAANAALLTDQANTPFTFLPNGGFLDVTIPANTQPGTYTGVLILNNQFCSDELSLIIVVSPATVGGTVTGGTTITSGNTSGLLTLSGHTGSVVKWQSSVSPFSTWSDIVNTNTTYTSGILTETTQYRAVVQSGTCSIVNSASTTVTVNALPTITAAASVEDRCDKDIEESSTPLFYSAVTGSPVTYSIVWDPSPANSFVAVTDESLLPNFIKIIIPAGTSAGTYTGTLTVKDANGISSLGHTFTAHFNEIPQITTTGEGVKTCSSSSASNALFQYLDSSGNPTSYSIDWSAEANAALLADQPNTPHTFLPDGGFIDDVTISPNTQPGLYTGVLTVYNEFCSDQLSVSILVSPATVGGTVTGGTTIPSGNTSSLLTLSGHTGSVVKWQSSVSPFSTWSDIANTSTTYTSGILTETTQFRAVVQSGACSTANSAPATVTVNALPTITASASTENVCADLSGGYSTPLFYSAVTGSPVKYSIVWDSSPANSFEAVTDESLEPDFIKIIIPAGTESGTYTGTLTVKDSNGVSSLGYAFTVTIGDIPSIDTDGTVNAVCASTSSQNALLEYFGISGHPISYSIDWDSAANAALLADQPNTIFNFEPFGGFLDVTVPSNTLPGSYSGVLIMSNETCSKEIPLNITINPLPTAPVIAEVIQPTEASPFGTVTLSGLPSKWTITSNPPRVSPSGSTPKVTILGLGQGTYTFTVTDENTGCTSEPSESVVINSAPLFAKMAPAATGDFEPVKNSISVAALNKVINVETSNQIIDKVSVFDISGNLIYEKNKVSDTKLIISDLKSGNQVLIVKVVLNNNEVETRKVIF